MPKMADTSVQEDMEVEENPGKSPKINDLSIIINGKNNEYRILIIFRVIFHKRTMKFGFFSLSKRVNLRVIFWPLSSLSSWLLLFKSVNYSFPWPI